MPNRDEHFRAANRLALGTATAGVILTFGGHPAIGLGVIWSSWYARDHITPDLDHHKKVRAQTVWYAYWKPYELRNAHRGRSHTWKGSIERFLYFHFLFLPLILLSFYVVEILTIILFLFSSFSIQLLIDYLHIYLDDMLGD